MVAGYSGVGNGFSLLSAGFKSVGVGFVSRNTGTALSFTIQPQSQTVDEYASAAFSCEVAGGVAPYSYQYKKNTANVGTNSAALSFTAAATDKNASITVVVTDSAGTAITSTAAVLGVTSYAYKYDGLTQYHRLSESISLVDNGVTVEFDFIANSGAIGVMVGGSGNGRLSWRFGIESGVIDAYRLASCVIDGVSYSTGSAFPLDGLVHHVVISVPSYRSALSSIGSGYANDTGVPEKFSNTRVFNFKAYRTELDVKIPLNNKSQGASQLATSGTINATIVNYNPAGWVAV